MKEEKVVTKEYVINGFKHFSQLAMEYFPAHSGYSAARKSMRDKIDENLQLKSELEAANYTDHTITLSPKMQQIIWAYIGDHPPFHYRKAARIYRTAHIPTASKKRKSNYIFLNI